ncbi:MAG TPA: DUF4386 family protein [Ktedonobacteraceae bacterium]
MKEQTERATRDHRWMAISGLLFVAAWVAGLLVTSPPAVTAPMANLIAYYEANRQMVIVQAYLTNGLTGILLLVFVAALQSVLRRAEGESSTLSNLLLVAGTVVTGLSCLEALFVQVLANDIAATQDAAVMRTLLELNAEIDTFKLPILGIMIAAASWLSWRVKALPPWLVWVGAVEALLLVVASGNSLFPGETLTIVLYISLLGLLVWTAAVSMMMGWRSRAVRAGGGLVTLSREARQH